MKILLLCEGDAETHDSWSGVSRSVVQHLRGLGHSVITADTDLYGLSRVRVALRSATWPRRRWWVRYHLGGAGFRARSALSSQRLRELGRDVDVLLQIGATFHTPRLPGVPSVLYCDSNIEMARAGMGSGFSEASVLTASEIDAIRAREAEVYANADLIFTMSHRLRRSFIDDFGLPPDRLVTVHCGPNVQVESVSEPEPTTEPQVLFVGRDFGRKGGEVLLRAFPEVRRRIPNAHLLVVGAQPRGVVMEGVTFMGFQSRDTAEGSRAIDRAYRSSTVFCLPTRFDPFGTSFVEAMSYELPCVGPDAWAVPEIIVNGETGLVVPPEDPAALAEALVELLSNPERARQMGRAARARVLEHFSWPTVVRRMVNALEPLVQQSSHARNAVASHP